MTKYLMSSYLIQGDMIIDAMYLKMIQYYVLLCRYPTLHDGSLVCNTVYPMM